MVHGGVRGLTEFKGRLENMDETHQVQSSSELQVTGVWGTTWGKRPYVQSSLIPLRS